jgi:hypothetical protein
MATAYELYCAVDLILPLLKPLHCCWWPIFVVVRVYVGIVFNIIIGVDAILLIVVIHGGCSDSLRIRGDGITIGTNI